MTGPRSASLAPAPAALDPLPARVVVTDLDRTFSRTDLTWDPAAVASCHALRDAGVRTVLASGQVLGVLADGSPLLDAFDAFILEGGALWGRPEDGWTATAGGAPCDPGIRALTTALVRRGVQVRRGLASLSVAIEDGPAVQAAPESRHVALRANRDRLDATPQGVDKAAALRQLLGQWNLPLAHAVGLGDGENDRDLLQAVGHGVAVANAVPELKAVAHEVAPHAASDAFVWVAQRVLAART